MRSDFRELWGSHEAREDQPLRGEPAQERVQHLRQALQEPAAARQASGNHKVEAQAKVMYVSYWVFL